MSSLRWHQRIPLRHYVLLALAVVLAVGVVEHVMGRLLLPKHLPVRFWVSEVDSSDNSQHLFDWYSFSHLIHGFIFYFLFFYLLGRWRQWPLGLVLLACVTLESAWEVLENSPFIINRYRSETASLDYTGDTILNSTSDILCCLLGFALARRLPVWASIVLILILEIGCAILIRDNLTLNVLMLLHPSEAIKHWQQARPH